MTGNREFAKFLEETAALLNFMGGNFFRVRALREAAHVIEHLEENIETLYKKGKLTEIEGIGKGIEEKIKQYLEKGDFDEHDELLDLIPRGILDMLKIPGLGPRKVKTIYDNLGISTLEELHDAAQSKKIRELEGFSERAEENIISGISSLNKYQKNILIVEADEISEEVLDMLLNIKGVTHAAVCGSLRRRKELIGDIDILFTSKSAASKIFTEIEKNLEQDSLISKGEHKMSFIWNDKCQVDLLSIKKKDWGSAMQYFTGSKEHSVSLRKHAVKEGKKVSEYGVFKGKKRLAGKNEIEFYNSLGYSYIPPELRENLGELDAAKSDKLPELVTLQDLKGDFHVHSSYSDGKNKIDDIARKAQDHGYEWIVITDHSVSLKVANGLDEKRLKAKLDEIKNINEKYEIEIISGQEVDILKDGTLDYPDRILKKIDMVIASVHTVFRMEQEKMTERIVRAMNNPYVDILGHPTGRLLNEREPYEVDMEKVLIAAQKTGTSIEINAYPNRLDLYYYLVKEAKSKGIKLAIGSDSHHVNELAYIRYGVDVARRGWLEKDDLLNCLGKKEIVEFIKNKR